MVVVYIIIKVVLSIRTVGEYYDFVNETCCILQNTVTDGTVQ